MEAHRARRAPVPSAARTALSRGERDSGSDIRVHAWMVQAVSDVFMDRSVAWNVNSTKHGIVLSRDRAATQGMRFYNFNMANSAASLDNAEVGIGLGRLQQRPFLKGSER